MTQYDADYLAECDREEREREDERREREYAALTARICELRRGVARWCAAPVSERWEGYFCCASQAVSVLMDERARLIEEA